MNLSSLITRIKLQLGIYTIALPFENPDEVFKDIIQNVTLRTFSTYAPYYEKFRFKLDELKCIEKNSNYSTYILPDVFSERELLFIRSVEYDESTVTGTGYWGGGIPMLHGNLINQAMLANAGMPLVNKLIPKVTFKYEHPRKVTLWNVYSSNTLVFEIAMMHDKSLASITPTEEESFYNLAVLDIKDMLYQSLKHYNDVQSAYGNISLKLDDWQSAAQDRKALLDEWDNTYHMDVLPFEWL